VFGDAIARRNPPFDEFGFVNTFTKVWQDEMRFVCGLFDLGNRELFRQ
jgi:hypothetical protein